jgi:DNA-binding SARP family transcriptional activator/tetratricopeptide (TPR) repeat protein
VAVREVQIDMLGGFRATVDGRPVEWTTRRSAELVQLLALTEGGRLAREQVIDALWPTLGAEAGAANLRKAAHHARQALGDPEALVLRGGLVSLGDVATDVAEFEAGGAYTGDLLPDAPYETWTQAPRERLRAVHLERLREAGDWERVVAADPTDEPAYRELMRRELAAGRRPAAIRWFGRLRVALRRELGLHPGPETLALYEDCIAGLATSEPVFVGRQLELARVTAVLRAGRGGALVLRGPGGIGKSALSREVARTARAEGWTVVGTTATESAGPYAPLAAVTERHADVLPGLGEVPRAVLTQLMTPTGGLTRHRVIGAFRRLLLAAAGDGPIALIVDDAHLADEATLDVLPHLGAPVLVVLAYRAEAAPPSLARGVARLARAGRVTELDLGPLGDDEAAALVAAGTSTPRDDATVERIVEMGHGNPFLVLELARSAVVGVPALVPTVRDAIASRFLDLDEPAAEALRRLALSGDQLDPVAAVALTGTAEPEAFETLDRALTTGVLVVHDGRYRFRHELVRQALVEQLAPHRRIAIHREIAERLAAVDASPGLIARHWLAGGRADDAVRWLLAAAREAVRLGAFADALAALEPLLAQQPEHGEALVLRAEALDARGDAAAPAAYRAAAEAVADQTGDDLRAKGALATIKLGDPPAGLQLLEGLEPTTLDGRIARALAFAGAAALGYGDPAIGTAQAAEARRLALEAADPAAVAVASWAQAAAAHARGELRESVRADLHDTAALPRLAVSAFDGQLCIAQRLLYGARPYDDVIDFADALAGEADRLGAARGRAFAVTIRGEAKLLAGRIDDAEVDLVEGARLHREIGAATGEAFALQRRAEAAMHGGRRDEASALLDEALAIARESDVGFHLFDRIYGAKIMLAEDPAAALAELEEAEEAVRGPVETCPGCRITLAIPAAIAAARAGDEARAEEWGRASEYLADVVMRLPAWDAALHELHGHRAVTPDDAAAHFRRAAEGFAAAGQPLDEARCVALVSG